MLKRSAMFVLAALAGIVAAGASQASAQAPKLMNEFRDWKVHRNDGAPARICFATSQPKETEPRGISRQSAYFYVSAFPEDGVKAEISLKLGFSGNENSNVLVQIGGRRFEMFIKGDKAFVSDPREELQLIDAMKRGSFMTITANTANGTQVKDTYSLLGVTAAIGAIDDCS